MSYKAVSYPPRDALTFRMDFRQLSAVQGVWDPYTGRSLHRKAERPRHPREVQDSRKSAFSLPGAHQ